jgi:hypothetical protein
VTDPEEYLLLLLLLLLLLPCDDRKVDLQQLFPKNLAVISKKRKTGGGS